jgi:Flp pilus assembly protein TadG
LWGAIEDRSGASAVEFSPIAAVLPPTTDEAPEWAATIRHRRRDGADHSAHCGHDMSRSFSRRLRAFAKDESAAAAVEFSLVAIPLLGLILAALQLSMIFFAGQMLQSAATNASRALMTGQAQKAGMTAAQFEQLICNPDSSLFDCHNLMVDVESAGSFSAVNTAPPKLTYDANGKVTNTWPFSPAGDIVIVKVVYNWPVFGPSALGLSDQPNGDHMLVAVTVFKNEPFPS